jgi:hypothetical protein
VPTPHPSDTGIDSDVQSIVTPFPRRFRYETLLGTSSSGGVSPYP